MFASIKYFTIVIFCVATPALASPVLNKQEEKQAKKWYEYHQPIQTQPKILTLPNSAKNKLAWVDQYETTPKLFSSKRWDPKGYGMKSPMDDLMTIENALNKSLHT